MELETLYCNPVDLIASIRKLGWAPHAGMSSRISWQARVSYALDGHFPLSEHYESSFSRSMFYAVFRVVDSLLQGSRGILPLAWPM